MSAKTTLSTNYFISGANRGIGFGLVKSLAVRPNTIIFAGTRDVSTSTELNQFTKTHPNVHPIKYNATSEEDAKNAIIEIKKITNKLDVVIANAGIANSYAPTAEETIAQYREHFEINSIGPVILFQATFPLLKSSQTPKFIIISTLLGTIGSMESLGQTFNVSAYGSSKAAANFIAKKIHEENKFLISFPLHPGWVQTDMGNKGAKANGLEQAPTSLEDSIAGLLKQIDAATRESHSGKYWSFDGTNIAW